MAESAKYWVMAVREVKTYTSNPIELEAIEQVEEIVKSIGEKLTYTEFLDTVEDAIKTHKAQGGKSVGAAQEISMKRKLKSKDFANKMKFLAVLGDKLLRAG